MKITGQPYLPQQSKALSPSTRITEFSIWADLKSLCTSQNLGFLTWCNKKQANYKISQAQKFTLEPLAFCTLYESEWNWRPPSFSLEPIPSGGDIPKFRSRLWLPPAPRHVYTRFNNHKFLVVSQTTRKINIHNNYKNSHSYKIIPSLLASEIISPSYVLGSKLVTASLPLHLIAALS